MSGSESSGGEELEFTTRFVSAALPACTLTRAEMTEAHELMQLPAGYSVRAPRDGETPNTQPGQGEIIIYLDQLRQGMTIPLSVSCCSLMRRLRIVPAMVVPKVMASLRLIDAFCENYRIQWSLEVFLYLYLVGPREVYVYTKPRSPKLFKTRGLTTSIHGWKGRYLIVSSQEGWPFPTVPGHAPKKAIAKPKVPVALRRFFEREQRVCYVLDSDTKLLVDPEPPEERAAVAATEPGSDSPPPKRQRKARGKKVIVDSSPSNSSATEVPSPSTDRGESVGRLDIVTPGAAAAAARREAEGVDPPPREEVGEAGEIDAYDMMKELEAAWLLEENAAAEADVPPAETSEAAAGAPAGEGVRDRQGYFMSDQEFVLTEGIDVPLAGHPLRSLGADLA